jgi:ubiquinone/menaquinone biosynthesis C-methylase UbiE
MLVTDYSKIAQRYDSNRLRHEIPVDENIARLLGERGRIRVLDLACGTGNYLERQEASYGDAAVEWLGLDKSPDMLAVARAKGLRAELIEGDVQALPFAEDSFDYVKLRFAFHHFENKPRAVAEIARVLKSGGELSIFSLAHDYAKDWWPYRYFPSAPTIDAERFMGSLAVYELLERHGFETRARIDVRIERFSLVELVDQTRLRDMSQLNLIREEEYRSGLEKLREDAGKSEYLIGDIAFLDCLARKR